MCRCSRSCDPCCTRPHRVPSSSSSPHSGNVVIGGGVANSALTKMPCRPHRQRRCYGRRRYGDQIGQISRLPFPSPAVASVFIMVRRASRRLRRFTASHDAQSHTHTHTRTRTRDDCTVPATHPSATSFRPGGGPGPLPEPSRAVRAHLRTPDTVSVHSWAPGRATSRRCGSPTPPTTGADHRRRFALRVHRASRSSRR